MSAKVMEKIWGMDQGLDSAELLVLLCLADFANDEGVSSPGFDRITDRCNMSVGALLHILGDLIDTGLLTLEGGEDGRAKFTIADPDAPRIISGT